MALRYASSDGTRLPGTCTRLGAKSISNRKLQDCHEYNVARFFSTHNRDYVPKAGCPFVWQFRAFQHHQPQLRDSKAWRRSSTLDSGFENIPGSSIDELQETLVLQFQLAGWKIPSETKPSWSFIFKWISSSTWRMQSILRRHRRTLGSNWKISHLQLHLQATATKNTSASSDVWGWSPPPMDGGKNTPLELAQAVGIPSPTRFSQPFGCLLVVSGGGFSTGPQKKKIRYVHVEFGINFASNFEKTSLKAPTLGYAKDGNWISVSCPVPTIIIISTFGWID